jgi:hypothetical protein
MGTFLQSEGMFRQVLLAIERRLLGVVAVQEKFFVVVLGSVLWPF